MAIDGPGGSGKSTVAKEVAKNLNFLYVDTGAMFRAIAYYYHSKNILHGDEEISPKGEMLDQFKAEECQQSLATTYFQLEYTQNSIKVNGEDVSNKIREHEISALASKVSRLPFVRAFLLDFQRTLARDQFSVMEGRDIGTVVFPQAFCKIFLTADLTVRTNRRLMELHKAGQTHITFEELFKDIERRDVQDSKRELAPLIQAADAMLIDTSFLTIPEVVNKICDYAKLQMKILGL